MTVYIDFETYYDKEVSLSKMTTIEYIKHPKFKVLGCAVIINNEDPQWFEGDTLPDVDWVNETVVAHNMYFDGSVLWHHFGIKPKMWACTESMARGLIAWPSYALKSISKALGIGEKTEGLTEGADESDQKLIDYALNDVILCKQIYDLLVPHMPEGEMDLISLTMKWGIVAQLCINIKKALKASRIASKARNELIATSGLPESLLASNKQFEGWIIEQGLNPPIKKNDKGLDTVALAKGDVQWVEFKKENPHLQHIWKAREAAKSIIGIQRPRRLAEIAVKTPERVIPMPLSYYGAHTGRFSGRDGINVQNLDKKSGIREAIIAPKGHVIVVVDSSQIELRMNAWFSDEQWVLDTLKDKGDVYCKTASAVLNRTVTKANETDRQFGKVVALGCGYGMGAEKFKDYCASGPLGMDPIELTEDEAISTIYKYRKANPAIVKSWKECDEVIRLMTQNVKHSPFKKNIAVEKTNIVLPNGMAIKYGNVYYEPQFESFVSFIKHNSKLYGAKIQENIVQALARIVVTDQILECERQGFNTVSSTHDEVLIIAKESEAEATLQQVIKIMSTPPQWCNDLPLGAEGKFKGYYSK